MRLADPLIPARLIKRYNRFLADATLETSGETVTAHIANPGSMMGLSTPGLRIWLSCNDDPKRKLKYSWELASLPDGGWSGVSTAHPNRIVEEALRARRIPELAAYAEVRREVAYGASSRIDFLLQGADQPVAYVEVKNVHLRRRGRLAEFPDSVTARGAKHLRELSDMVRQGARAVMLYLVQRDDCDAFALAEDIDPAYVAAYRAARAAGVEATAWRCDIRGPDPETGGGAEIRLATALPIAEF